METSPQPPSESDELEPLVAAMTPDQQLRFKQAVVRQAIHFVSRRLPPEEEDDGHRACINVAMAWLLEPTEARASDAATFAISECWDGGARYDDYPRVFLEPVYAVGLDGCASARRAVYAALPEEQDAARRWQVAAADAILRGEEPSALV
jgi:hypothetical protein